MEKVGVILAGGIDLLPRMTPHVQDRIVEKG